MKAILTQALCVPMNKVFANHSKEDKIYHLTTAEIAKAQWADTTLKYPFKLNAVLDNGLEIKLIENINCACVCNDGPLVITRPLNMHAVMWYPWIYMSQRDNEHRDVLERYMSHHPDEEEQY
jgi:hypothetical protein